MDGACRTDFDAFEMAGTLADVDDGEASWLDMDGVRRAGAFAGPAANAFFRIDNGNDF